ncbi:MAG: hypothetical protein SFY32_00830 [Bacteroidota bacterium]|nr:hypothetical protein [Bacteroidota bacterium]
MSILKKEVSDIHSLVLKASLVLQESYDRACLFGIKNEYDLDEKIEIEALTARFARMSDLITQKLLRSILIILKEPSELVIDRINKSAKYGIIENDIKMLEIRDLRNEIAHEYIPDEIDKIYIKVFELTPVLLSEIKNISSYIQSNPQLFN